MDAKHTPGPWRWWLCKDGSYDSNNDYVQVAGMPEHVAQIRIASVSEADLFLIAAAPDLLEALQEMVDGDADAIDEAKALGVPFPEEMLKAYRKAISAIAKATGGQT